MASNDKTSYPVVVSCLNKRTTEKTVFFHFKKFGKILNEVKIMKHPDGTSKCFGYVNFVEENAAKTACNAMNGFTLDGSVISTLAKPSTKKSLTIDYQELTDCIHFQRKNCTKPNCPYRHVKVVHQYVCNSWENNSCKNIDCIYAHPAKHVNKKIAVVAPQAAGQSLSSTLFQKMAINEQPLKENTAVYVNINGKTYHGIIRWIGIVRQFGENNVAGIHLESPIDQGNDGVFQGQRYFSCPEKCGFFVQADQCKVSRRPSMESDTKKTREYICSYYLKNLCANGEKCDFLHPPRHLPFCWYYKTLKDNNIQVFPEDLNMKLEKCFCDPMLKDYTINDQLVVEFDDLDKCMYKGDRAKFTRLSTKSSAIAPNEHYSTEWKWYWLDENDMWLLYDLPGSVTSEILEEKYQRYLKQNNDDVFGFGLSQNSFQFKTKKFSYEIKFSNMTQRNSSVGTIREIRRRPKFVDISENAKNQDGAGAMKMDFPSNWPSSTKYGDVKLLPVANDTRSKIERDFALTMKTRMNYQIISVQEVCNKELYTQFGTKRKLMEEKNPNVNEKQLWHGTNCEHVEHICHQNFDWRLCSRAAFGIGSYFAKDANYSHGYTIADSGGIMSMFYADILVGDYAKGSSEYKRPPPKDNSKYVLYDSCVNDMSNPTMYIIFEKDQCYPRYLVKYKRAM